MTISDAKSGHHTVCDSVKMTIFLGLFVAITQCVIVSQMTISDEKLGHHTVCDSVIVARLLAHRNDNT